ncbi:hypothetical protein [Devosia submarina]|uniref:hypothetical protein n=1 Tax=Devosia submarina TaxID=1173082 RepID=UPI001300677B|nr:hypothetical protein [Devosia submarina]
MDLLDSYVLRARLFPAILAAAPAIVFLLANVAASLDSLGLPQVLLTVAIAVLFFALADLARRLGRREEKSLFNSSGGRPFPTVLRHIDEVLDAKSKARYLAFLSEKLGERAPSANAELKDPAKADAFYVSAGNWIREHTRDTTKFHLLFAENVVYGFRRNLFGLKRIGLALNLLTVMISLWLLWHDNWNNMSQYSAVLVVAALHAAYFLFGVTKQSVLQASEQYGRQLALSCDTLMDIQAASSAH